MDDLAARIKDNLKEIKKIPRAPTLTEGTDLKNRQDANADFDKRRNRVHARPAIYAALVGLVTFFSSLVTFWFAENLVPSTITLRAVLGVAIAQGIVAAMFVLFAALIGMGRARQRREAERTSAGGGVSTEALAANRQALIGLVGTSITAILAFFGVLVQVFSSGGGQAGGG